MRKIFAFAAALALITGAALAQDANFEAGESPVSVDQTITLTIPPRVALHIDQNAWTLDLTGDISGQHCYAVSKSADTHIRTNPGSVVGAVVNFATEINEYIKNMTDPQQALNDLDAAVSSHGATNLATQALGGPIYLATSYPAVNIDGADDVSGDDDKGYVLCLFGKTIQKFSNYAGGWSFSAELSGATASFGAFGIVDISDGSVQDGFTATGDHGPTELASGNGTTGGWLDDLIFEGFYFDGTEVAQEDTQLTVTYSLTGTP